MPDQWDWQDSPVIVRIGERAPVCLLRVPGPQGLRTQKEGTRPASEAKDQNVQLECATMKSTVLLQDPQSGTRRSPKHNKPPLPFSPPQQRDTIIPHTFASLQANDSNLKGFIEKQVPIPDDDDTESCLWETFYFIFDTSQCILYRFEADFKLDGTYSEHPPSAFLPIKSLNSFTGDDGTPLIQVSGLGRRSPCDNQRDDNEDREDRHHGNDDVFQAWTLKCVDQVMFMTWLHIMGSVAVRNRRKHRVV